jgi:CheY-like chemotaxis protein
MTARSVHILLVEDSPNDAELAIAALRDHRVANQIDVARDGEEALDYFYRRGKFSTRSNGNPGLVLLDVKMPKVDGIEVLRQIKADPNLKSIPVVMLTSSREERDVAECYLLGVNAYVVKPVDFSQFMGAVKQIGNFWLQVNEPPPA